MTSTATPFRAFIAEPFELAIGQPHQFLISSASITIVALEAGTLVPFPANIALAVGAEWAFLRGLITGAGVKTRWAAALYWAAIVLVFGYGGLWSFRQAGILPKEPGLWLAALLTVIHIGAIGAVTICSAMLHRVSADIQAAEQRAARTRAEDHADEERRYQAELQRQRDAQQLELERKQHELALYEQAEQAKVVRQLDLEKQRAQLRASVRAQRTQNASGTAPNSAANTDREQLRRTVAERLREQPEANRSQLARSLGIGRTTLYELIAEAKRIGELE